jgi:hypothetical protein
VPKNLVSLAPGVVVEELGNNLLVLTPGSQKVVTLGGKQASALRTVLEGDQPVIDDTVKELVSLQILHGATGMSRRGLLTAGSLGALSTVAILSLPTAAAASSEVSGIPVTGAIYLNTNAGTRFAIQVYLPIAVIDSDDLSPGAVLRYANSTYEMEFDTNNGVSGDGTFSIFAYVTTDVVTDSIQAGAPFTLDFFYDSTLYTAAGNDVFP